MTRNTQHAEAKRLARELPSVTGETLTEAVVAALRERLERQQQRRPKPSTGGEILSEVRSRLSRLPVLDARSADEILGYDERGLPR
jgi:antitoxin VapB